jgi:two-component system, NarL family, sensor histidine kinase UhpB
MAGPCHSSVAQQPQVLVEKVLDEIRQLSAAIRPQEFATLSIKEALDQLIYSIQRVKKEYLFEIEVCQLAEERLTDQHKLMIYRVVQEQVNNILKYAQPHLITITIQSKGDLVTIVVEDDGSGFDPQRAQGGIGLRNIQSRLQIFGGHMKIDSSPGNGCILYAQFHVN